MPPARPAPPSGGRRWTAYRCCLTRPVTSDRPSRRPRQGTIEAPGRTISPPAGLVTLRPRRRPGAPAAASARRPSGRGPAAASTYLVAALPAGERARRPVPKQDRGRGRADAQMVGIGLLGLAWFAGSSGSSACLAGQPPLGDVQQAAHLSAVPAGGLQALRPRPPPGAGQLGPDDLGLEPGERARAPLRRQGSSRVGHRHLSRGPPRTGRAGPRSRLAHLLLAPLPGPAPSEPTAVRGGMPCRSPT